MQIAGRCLACPFSTISRVRTQPWNRQEVSVPGLLRPGRVQPVFSCAQGPRRFCFCWACRGLRSPLQAHLSHPTERLAGGSKFMKRLLKWIAIVIAVLVVVVLVLPFLIDVNMFRPRIESELTNAVGRKVTVGNLKLSLWSGSLAADNIAIADDPAFSNQP